MKMPMQLNRLHRDDQTTSSASEPFFSFIFDEPMSVDVSVKLSPLAAIIIIMFILVIIIAIITVYRTFNTMYILNKM